MKGFFGTVDHQLDDKSRIRIPAKFLEVFNREYEHEKLYFVIYNRNRLAIMPESVLNKKLEFFDNITPDDEEGSDALSKLYGSIDEVSKDSQGRAIIPKSLRSEVFIEKDVVTVGMGEYIEVWAKEVRLGVDKMTAKEANQIVYASARRLREV